MKFKLVESIDDRLVEKINWTDEQKRDIIDMYNSQELNLDDIANKYKVSRKAISNLLKNHNIQLRTNKIEWTDEQVADIIDMYTLHKINTKDIGKKYGKSVNAILDLLTKHNIPLRSRGTIEKKYPVYLNTISYIGSIINSSQLSTNITLEYTPSIKLGDYTRSEIGQIYDNLRKRISTRIKATGSETFAFYMKLLQEGNKEENIKQLINDILDIDSNQSEVSYLSRTDRVKILTIDDASKIKDNYLVEFYSFEDIAKDWMIEVGSKVENWAEPNTNSGKYLKELALQYYTPTAGNNDYKQIIKQYGLNNIIYSLFDKYGNRIDPTNYKNKINEIPYEAEFNISSLEDLNNYFRLYGKHRDILYGYIDKNYRVVYVGITQSPYSRGDMYSKSDQENRAIAKALTLKIITKLIIFKSYLPTVYAESSSKLLRQLEIEFAEKIFKTYDPENKNKSFEELVEAGTLNIDESGKNQNRRVVNSIQDYAAKLAANSLLSRSEYEKELKSKFDDSIAKHIQLSNYSYVNYYLPIYILKHKESWKIDFLRNKVATGRYKWLFPQIKSLDELNELMNEARISAQKKAKIRDNWKAFNNKNNQYNTDNLDDNINADDYK